MRGWRLPVALAVALLAVGASAAPAMAARNTPTASLTDIESQVMCVTCGIPLSIAESPAADQERSFIRDLISRGESSAQIKSALVAQLGPDVLALPQRNGFNLAVYIVPAALILALSILLAVALPRWRRRGGDGGGGDGPDLATGSGLTDADGRRLDEELARYGS